MTGDCDEIASAVLEEFRKLPAKRKPCVRDNGLHEWVPLAGIVAKGPGWVRCVALATGMKCLPASKLSQANGTAIHDWHAEVLAMRSFNYFVLEESRRLSLGDDETTSDFIRRRTGEEIGEYKRQKPERDDEDCWHGQPFTWKDDVSLHMYCSEAPCGDASMELIMAAQDDASPWAVPGLPDETTQETPSSEQDTAPELLGRGYFSQLGIVRRKPSRGDAPPSLSKSCSDKLALKQCTSLLSSLSSLFVSPSSAYLTSIILPESQYSPTGCQRCFSATSSEGENLQDNGRMKPLLPYLRHSDTTAPTASAQDTAMSKIWRSSGYAFVPFKVHTTTLEFDFSKRTVAAAAERKAQAANSRSNMAASNLAVAWTANGLNEGIIGGVLQGRKKFDIKGASAVSRTKLWKLANQVAENLVGIESSQGCAQMLLECLSSEGATYDEVKGCLLLKGRQAVKEEARREALKGWIRNTGDGGFRLSDQ
ncbi:Adenosine deaminase/editase [Naviculisporaceae sp. PSN 640]